MKRKKKKYETSSTKGSSQSPKLYMPMKSFEETRKTSRKSPVNKRKRNRTSQQYGDVDYLDQSSEEYFGRVGPKLVSPEFHSPGLKQLRSHGRTRTQKTGFPLLSEKQQSFRIKDKKIKLGSTSKLSHRESTISTSRGLRKVGRLLDQVRLLSKASKESEYIQSHGEIDEVRQKKSRLESRKKYEMRSIVLPKLISPTESGEVAGNESFFCSTERETEGMYDDKDSEDYPINVLDFLAFERYSTVEAVEIDLKLWWNVVTDSRIKSLFHNNTSCRYLDMSGCVRLTDEGLISCVECCAGLETLYVAGCSKITDNGISKVVEICGESLLDLDLSKNYEKDSNFSIGELVLSDRSIVSVSKCCPDLRRICLREQAAISNTSLRWLSRGCKHLSHIDITYCKEVTSDGLSLLGENCYRSLLNIKINELNQVDNTGFKDLLGKSFYIKELDASGLELITDAAIRKFVETKVFWGYRQHSGYSRMKRLNLKDCLLLTGVSLSWIATGCPNLELLSISGCIRVDDYGLKAVGTLHKLENLDISRCTAITDAGLLYLIHDNHQLHKLTYLNISYMNKKMITDEGLIPIVQEVGIHLRELVAYEIWSATDAFLRALAKHAGDELRCVKVSGNGSFTAAGVGAFGQHCYYLKTMVLQSCNLVGKDALSSVMKLRHLETLDLTHCENLSSHAMTVVPNWKLLHLSLRHTQQTDDDAIDAIALCCHELKKLNITLCQKVTDKSIGGILSKRCPYLLELNTLGCHQVTRKSLLRFASHPRRKEKQVEVIDMVSQLSCQDIYKNHIETYNRCSFSGVYSECFRGCRPSKASESKLYQHEVLTQQQREMIAVVILQCAIRCLYSKRILHALKIARAELEKDASTLIQRIIRGWLARILANFEKKQQLYLSTRLQYLWRRYWIMKQKRKALIFWQKRTLASSFITWHENAMIQSREREEAKAREKFKKSAEFWSNNIYKKLIKAWKKYTAHSKWKKEKLPKAINFWKTSTYRRYFIQWNTLTQEQVQIRKHLVVIFLQCVSIESRNARKAKSQIYVANRYNNKFIKRNCLRKLRKAVAKSKHQMEIALVFMRQAFLGNVGALVFRSWRMFTILAKQLRLQEEAAALLTIKFAKRRGLRQLRYNAKSKVTNRNNKKRALILLLNQTKFRTWNSWVGFVSEQKSDREKARKALMFLKNACYVKVFRNWAKLTKRRIHNRESIAKCLTKLKFQSVTKAFIAWHENINNIKDFRERARRRLGNRTVAKAISQWKAFSRISREERHQQLKKWVRLNDLAASIQSRWRGVMGREYVEDKRLITQLMCIKLQAFFRMCLAKLEQHRQFRYATLKEYVRAEKETDLMRNEEEIADKLVQEYKAARLCQQYYRAKHARDLSYVERGLRQRRREEKRIKDAQKTIEEHERKEKERQQEEAKQNYKATQIQKCFRGLCGRVRFKELWALRYLSAQAIIIQANYRARIAIRTSNAKRRLNKFTMLTRQQTRKNTRILRFLGLKTKGMQLRYGDDLHYLGLHPDTYTLELWKLRDELREDGKKWKRFAANQIEALRRGGLDADKRREVTRAFEQRMIAEAWIRKGDSVQIIDPRNRYRCKTGYVLNIIEVPNLPGGEQAVVKLDHKNKTIFVPLKTLETPTEASTNSMIRIDKMGRDWENAAVTLEKVRSNQGNILDYVKPLRRDRDETKAALLVQRNWRGKKMRKWVEEERPKQEAKDKEMKGKVLRQLTKLNMASARSGRILIASGLVWPRHIPDMPEKPITPKWAKNTIENFQNQLVINKIASVIIDQRRFRMKALTEKQHVLKAKGLLDDIIEKTEKDYLEDDLINMRWRLRTWWRVALWKAFEKGPEKAMILGAEKLMRAAYKLQTQNKKDEEKEETKEKSSEETKEKSSEVTEPECSDSDEEEDIDAKADAVTQDEDIINRPIGMASDEEGSKSLGDTEDNSKNEGSVEETKDKEREEKDPNCSDDSEETNRNIESSEEIETPEGDKDMEKSIDIDNETAADALNQPNESEKGNKIDESEILSVKEALKGSIFDFEEDIEDDKVKIVKHVAKEITKRGLVRVAKLLGGPQWRTQQDVRDTWIGLYKFPEYAKTFHMKSEGWGVYHGTWDKKGCPHGHGVIKFLLDTKEEDEEEDESMVSAFKLTNDYDDMSDSDIESEDEDDKAHSIVKWNYREYMGYCSDDSDGINDTAKNDVESCKSSSYASAQEIERPCLPQYEYETVVGQIEKGFVTNHVKIVMRNRSTYIGPYVSEFSYKNEDTIVVSNGHHGVWKTFGDEIIYEGNTVTNHFDEKNVNGIFKVTTKLNGEVYHGRMTANQRDGEGKCIYPNGDEYQGSWLLGEKHGRGRYTWSSKKRVYVGEWQEGKKHGFGKELYEDGSTYEGEYEKSRWHGTGTLIKENGDKYVGNFVKDIFDGNGVMQYSNGSQYEGMWKNGLRHTSIDSGAATYIEVNGDQYKVPYSDDMMHGQGVFYPKTVNGFGCEKYGLWQKGRLIRWLRTGISDVTTQEFNDQFKVYGDYKSPFSMIVSHELPLLPPGVDPDNRGVEQHVDGILRRAGPLAATKVLERSTEELEKYEPLAAKLADALDQAKKDVVAAEELLEQKIELKCDQADLVQRLEDEMTALKTKIVAFWDSDDPKYTRNRFRNAFEKLVKADAKDWYNCKHVRHPPSIYLKLWKGIARLLGNLMPTEQYISMLSGTAKSNRDFGDEAAFVRDYDAKLVDEIQHNFDVYKVCRETVLVSMVSGDIFNRDMKAENVELSQISAVVPSLVVFFKAMFHYIRRAEGIVDEVDNLKVLKKKLSFQKEILLARVQEVQETEEELKKRIQERDSTDEQLIDARQKLNEVTNMHTQAKKYAQIAQEAEEIDISVLEPDDKAIVPWLSREDEAIQKAVQSKIDDMLDLVCNIDVLVWDTLFTIKETIVAQTDYEARYNAAPGEDSYVLPEVRDLMGHMVNRVASNDKESIKNGYVELQVSDALNQALYEIAGVDKDTEFVTTKLVTDTHESFMKAKRKQEREEEFLNQRVVVRSTEYKPDGTSFKVSNFGTVTAIYDTYEDIPSEPIPGSGLIFCDESYTIFGYEDTTKFTKEILPGYIIMLPCIHIPRNDDDGEAELRFEERTVTETLYDYQLNIDEPFSHLCFTDNWSKDWAYRDPYNVVETKEYEVCDIVYDDGEVERGVKFDRIEKQEMIESEDEVENSTDESESEDAESVADDYFLSEWVEYIHEETGTPYWHNPKTKQTTWTQPFQFRKAVWKQFYESDAKAIFWFNSEKNETTWSPPEQK